MVITVMVVTFLQRYDIFFKNRLGEGKILFIGINYDEKKKHQCELEEFTNLD